MTVRHVSLLRGINVGGHNLVSMARLRALYEALGCEDVATYLQSGNVVFRRDRDPAGVGKGVERAIKRELGIDVRVLDRSHGDMAAIVEADPFPGADPSRRFVMFLSAAPGTEIAREIEQVKLGPDEVPADRPGDPPRLPGRPRQQQAARAPDRTPARGDRDHAELADGQPAAGALGRLGLSRRSVTPGRPAAASR